MINYEIDQLSTQKNKIKYQISLKYHDVWILMMFFVCTMKIIRINSSKHFAESSDIQRNILMAKINPLCLFPPFTSDRAWVSYNRVIETVLF